MRPGPARRVADPVGVRNRPLRGEAGPGCSPGSPGLTEASSWWCSTTTARPPRQRSTSRPDGSAPLAQGVLTDKYLHGIPAGSRASRGGSLSGEEITDEVLARVRALHDVASGRGQTPAQTALAWVLRDPRVTSALVGASSVQQLEDNVAALQNLEFSDEELARIDRHCPGRRSGARVGDEQQHRGRGGAHARPPRDPRRPRPLHTRAGGLGSGARVRRCAPSRAAGPADAAGPAASAANRGLSAGRGRPRRSPAAGRARRHLRRRRPAPGIAWPAWRPSCSWCPPRCPRGPTRPG